MKFFLNFFKTEIPPFTEPPPFVRAAQTGAGIPLKNMGTLMPNEVATAVEIENEKQKDFYKMLTWMCYNCAALTGVAMNDPKKFPSLNQIRFSNSGFLQ